MKNTCNLKFSFDRKQREGSRANRDDQHCENADWLQQGFKNIWDNLTKVPSITSKVPWGAVSVVHPSLKEHILIRRNQELFELGPEDLHQLYMKMHEDVPEAMDYQLRRRAILNGDEWVIRQNENRQLAQTDKKLMQTGKN